MPLHTAARTRGAGTTRSRRDSRTLGTGRETAPGGAGFRFGIFCKDADVYVLSVCMCVTKERRRRELEDRRAERGAEERDQRRREQEERERHRKMQLEEEMRAEVCGLARVCPRIMMILMMYRVILPHHCALLFLAIQAWLQNAQTLNTPTKVGVVWRTVRAADNSQLTEQSFYLLQNWRICSISG